MATRAEGEERGGAGACSDDTERVSSSASIRSATSRAIKSDDESWNGILERACSSLSDGTTSEMVEVANSERLQKAVDDLLPVYFKTWQLQSTESILVFILLNFFVLRQECCALKADRGDYEDHIARLKKCVGDLEEENNHLKQLHKLKDREHRRSPAREDRRCQDSEGEVARLTQNLQDLTLENSRLHQAKDEVRGRVVCSMRVAGTGMRDNGHLCDYPVCVAVYAHWILAKLLPFYASVYKFVCTTA